MLLTQTSNLLSDNAVLLPNRNIRVKCFYDKAKKNKISKFSYMEKSVYSKNLIFLIFVAFMKLKKQ